MSGDNQIQYIDDSEDSHGEDEEASESKEEDASESPKKDPDTAWSPSPQDQTPLFYLPNPGESAGQLPSVAVPPPAKTVTPPVRFSVSAPEIKVGQGAVPFKTKFRAFLRHVSANTPGRIHSIISL